MMEKWRSERVFSLFLKISSYGIEQWLWMTKRWKEELTNVIFKIGYFQPMRRPHQGSSRVWNCAAAKVWAFTKVAKEGRSRHMVRVWVVSWHICVSTQIDLRLLIFSCYTLTCVHVSVFKNKFVDCDWNKWGGVNVIFLKNIRKQMCIDQPGKSRKEIEISPDMHCTMCSLYCTVWKKLKLYKQHIVHW